MHLLRLITSNGVAHQEYAAEQEGNRKLKVASPVGVLEKLAEIANRTGAGGAAEPAGQPKHYVTVSDGRWISQREWAGL